MYYLKLNVKDVKLKSKAFNSLLEFFQFINIDEDTHNMLPKRVREKFIVIDNCYKPFYIPKYVVGSDYNIAELYNSNGECLDFNLLFIESLRVSNDIHSRTLDFEVVDFKNIVKTYICGDSYCIADICDEGETRSDNKILFREDFDFALNSINDNYNYFYFSHRNYYNLFSRQVSLDRLICKNLEKVNGSGNNYYRLIKHYGYNRNKCVIDYNDRILRDEYGIGIGGSKSKMVTNWDDIYSSSKLSKCWKKHKVKKQYMKYKVMWTKKDPI